MSHTSFQFRRGIKAEWETINPILAEGELGLELDTNQFKIGNGIEPWTELPYGGIQGPVGNIVANLPQNPAEDNTIIYKNGQWVASVIPKELPYLAYDGQVLTYVSGEWLGRAIPSQLPSTATEGQVLTYVNSQWVANSIPSQLPSTANEGEVLTYINSQWVASNVLPIANINERDVLTYINGSWVASAAPIELPQGATAGQVLVYDGVLWVATDPVIELPLSATTGQLLGWTGTSWQATNPIVELPATAISGQLLSWTGAAWEAVDRIVELPLNALDNQVVLYDEVLAEWVAADIPNSLPRVADEGQILRWVGGEWTADTFDVELPASAIVNQVLKWSGTNWVAGNIPTELPQVANLNQVLTWSGTEWVASNIPSELPQTANVDQVLSWSGTEWVPRDNPKELPSTANVDQILRWSGAEWVASNDKVELPQIANVNQVVTWSGARWIAEDIPKELPNNASINQVVSWSGSSWIAKDIPKELPNNASLNQVVAWNGTEWVAKDIERQVPLIANINQTLTWSGSNWIASDRIIELPLIATQDQVLTWVGSSWIAKDLPNELPRGSALNEVATWNGIEWIAQSIEKELPQIANEDQILVYKANQWVANDLPTELPQIANEDQILVYKANQWVAQDKDIELPINPNEGSELIYIDGNWVAQTKYKGAWTSTVEYNIGDIILWDNKVLICTKNNAEAPTTQLDVLTLEYKGNHIVGKVYYRNEIVLVENDLYIFKEDQLNSGDIYNDLRDTPSQNSNWKKWDWRFINTPLNLTDKIAEDADRNILGYSKDTNHWVGRKLIEYMPTGGVNQALVVNENNEWGLKTIPHNQIFSHYVHQANVTLTLSASLSYSYVILYFDNSILETTVDIQNIREDNYVYVYNTSDTANIIIKNNTTIIDTIYPRDVGICYAKNSYNEAPLVFTLSSQFNVTQTINKIGKKYEVLYKNASNEIVGNSDFLFNEIGVSINKQDPANAPDPNDPCQCVDPIVLPNYGLDIGYETIADILKASINLWGNIVFSKYNFQIGGTTTEGLVLNEEAKYKLRLRNQTNASLVIEQSNSNNGFTEIAKVGAASAEFNSTTFNIKSGSTEVADFTATGITFHVPVNLAANVDSIPSGTKMLFVQAAAPVGWTQVIDHDNKALRVVSGVGGDSGGSLTFTDTFRANREAWGTVDGTALSLAQMPGHTHVVYAAGDHIHGVNSPSGYPNLYEAGLQVDAQSNNNGPADGVFRINVDNGIPNNGNSPGADAVWNMTAGSHTHTTGNEGAGQAHTHAFVSQPIPFDVQYIDVIVCVKT